MQSQNFIFNLSTIPIAIGAALPTAGRHSSKVIIFWFSIFPGAKNA